MTDTTQYRTAWAALQTDAVKATGATTDYDTDPVTGDPYLEVIFQGDIMHLTPSVDGDDFLEYTVHDSYGDLVSCDREMVDNYSGKAAGTEYAVAEALEYLALSFLDLN